MAAVPAPHLAMGVSCFCASSFAPLFWHIAIGLSMSGNVRITGQATREALARDIVVGHFRYGSEGRPGLLFQFRTDYQAGDATFDFLSRNRRPPKDLVNAVLSFLYPMTAKQTAVYLALLPPLYFDFPVPVFSVCYSFSYKNLREVSVCGGCRSASRNDLFLTSRFRRYSRIWSSATSWAWAVSSASWLWPAQSTTAMAGWPAALVSRSARCRARDTS